MNTTISLTPNSATILVRCANESKETRVDVDCIGDSKMLDRPAIGLFCSSKCPGDAILSAMKWVGGAAGNSEYAIAAGFHSAMEKSFLEALLAGSCSILVFPARSLARYRVPTHLRQPISDRRLAIVSRFGDSTRSASASTGRQRNQFVAEIATHLVVAYAAPGSRTEEFALRQLEDGRQVWCLHRGCTALTDAGARILPSQFDIKGFGVER